MEKKLSFNASQLKILAVVSMIIDHMAYGLVSEAAHPTLYFCMRAFGRLAFPIFAFFIVEGFYNTRSFKKYALRLLILALISEVPFDLFFEKSSFYPAYQCTIWTLLIGLIAIAAMARVDHIAGKIAVAAAFCSLAWLFKSDYDAYGVLLIEIIYMLRPDRRRQCVTAGCLALYQTFACCAFVPLYYYNGERGRRIGRFFYIFYPVHLLILYGVSRFLTL